MVDPPHRGIGITVAGQLPNYTEFPQGSSPSPTLLWKITIVESVAKKIMIVKRGVNIELPYKKSNRKGLKKGSLPDNIGNRKKKRLPVTKQAKREYINELRARYRAARKLEQGSILDEMEKVTTYHRKYLIRALNRRVESSSSKRTPTVGRPSLYDAPELTAFLKYLWHATNQACGKRLKSILPQWLPWYEEASGIRLSLVHQVLLTRMAHTTIDRLLADERSHYRFGKGRATTKPGTLIKKRIPIKTEQWKEKRPGFLEVDTVAHCGSSMAGMFVYSLNTVDIGSGWVEPRAVWGKGELNVLEALRNIEQALPFRLRGVDADNGGEFINHHLETYLRGRKRRVEYTRSREYKKNDNAHIEQKNWTHIRQTFGYERIDNPTVVAAMNALYANEYSLLMNFFLPSVKLQHKHRIGSTIVKKHDAPLTPCQRLLASRSLSKETTLRLRKLQQSLNPFLLHRTIQQKVKLILQQRSLAPTSTSRPSRPSEPQPAMIQKNQMLLYSRRRPAHHPHIHPPKNLQTQEN